MQFNIYLTESLQWRHERVLLDDDDCELNDNKRG